MLTYKQKHINKLRKEFRKYPMYIVEPKELDLFTDVYAPGKVVFVPHKNR